MLVEHTFITTREEEDALGVAHSFLHDLGFQDDPDRQGKIFMRRGRPRPRRDVSFAELPQAVRLDFDRGRVTVAASIEIIGKPEALHREIPLTLVKSLERLLARGAELEEAIAPWREVMAKVDDLHRLRRLGTRITLGCLILIAAVCVGYLVVYLSSR